MTNKPYEKEVRDAIKRRAKGFIFYGVDPKTAHDIAEAIVIGELRREVAYNG